MQKRTFTPTRWRLGMLLLIASLVIGIGTLAAGGSGSGASAAAKDAEVATAATKDAEVAVAATNDAEAPAAAMKDAEVAADATNDSEAAADATKEAEAAALASVAGRTVSRMRTTTQAQRLLAARRNAERTAKSEKLGVSQPQAGTSPCNLPLGQPCTPIDYFGTVPHYALSQLHTSGTTGIRKFKDDLPGLGPANYSVSLGTTQFIPIASPMTNPWDTTSDYYEIGLIDYTRRFHSDLVDTTQVRGYMDLNQNPFQAFGALPFTTTGHYLGPVIIAQRDRPVRVKFTNLLAKGSFFFLPADDSYMGMNNYALGNPTGNPYSKNRATLHNHGGLTPWISDGTPHQWTVPKDEYATELLKTTSDGGHNFARGVSVSMVPDMFFDAAGKAVATGTTGASTDPGNGSLTFFYTNAQSGRLMFYHDHSWGLTRLNVYAGEAAGYLIHDPLEDALIGTAIPNNAGVDKTSAANLKLAGLTVDGSTTGTPLAGGLYNFGIPLIIQDKTFVPDTAQLGLQDPSWNWGNTGNLWFPHVYMPNQNPNDDSGATQNGRWDYGPWFWPPMTSADLAHGQTTCLGSGDKTTYGTAALCPGTLNPSGVPESFMDTPLVNGVAYPKVTLPQGTYRFQILNAANDRMFNLSLFYAADGNGNVCKTGYTRLNTAGTSQIKPAIGECTEVKMVPAVPHALIVPLNSAAETLPACVSTAGNPGNPDVHLGDGFLVYANPGAIDYNSVTGLPGKNTACWPSSWPTDGRDGGVPDPTTAGPAWVQIGTEGGVLPQAVVIPPTPVGYNYNRRDIVVTNIQEHALFMGPAERVDVIVDLSQVPVGSTLILYNDAPAPVPGYDVRLDYYTGAPDLSTTGGAPTPQAGYGPNIRTVMQINVVGTTSTTDYMTTSGTTGLFALQSALPGVFQKSQPPIIIPQKSYPAAALHASGGPPIKDTYARIQNTQGLTFTPINPTGFDPAITIPLQPKAIHELFENDYGKMNSILAAEIPLTNYNNQTTLPLAYVDPPTEFVAPGQTQLWKVTHNGVDSHAMHFHLFDVQLINRVGWDGAIRPPDPNELGWKETVRMNPLEDAIVALRPIQPPLPFGIGPSNRLLDPSRAKGATNTGSQPGFSNNNPSTGNQVTTVNAPYDFGWEYVWHCHLLGHEESDMMRPIVLRIATPFAPYSLGSAPTGATGAQHAVLSWVYTQGPTLAQTFSIMRSQGTAGAFSPIATVPVSGLQAAGTTTTYPNGFTDPLVMSPGVTYYYQVVAVNTIASSNSAPSNTVQITPLISLNPPTLVKTLSVTPTQVIMAWTASVPVIGGTVTGYTIQRAPNTVVGIVDTPGVFATVGTSTTTNFRDAGLTTKTKYWYQVQATGTVAPSAFTGMPMVTTP